MPLFDRDRTERTTRPPSGAFATPVVETRASTVRTDRTADPRTADTRTAESRTAESRTAEPRTAGARTRATTVPPRASSPRSDSGSLRVPTADDAIPASPTSTSASGSAPSSGSTPAIRPSEPTIKQHRPPAMPRARTPRPGTVAATATSATAARARAAVIGAIARVAAIVRAVFRRDRANGNAPAVDPTLPAAAQIIQVQHPSANLPPRPYDLVLLVAVLGLLGIGTVEIYSATAADGVTRHGDSLGFLARQLVFAGVGGVAMWIAARIDYLTLKRWSYPLLALAMLMLAAALATHAKNGAKRWIPLGPFTFQPVEIAKLALVAYLASSLARKADRVKTFTIGFVPHLVVCGMMMALLLKQPDLGSSVVLGATTLGMLFVAGARISYIALAVLGSAPVAYHLVVGTPWRMQRFLAYFNPEAYASSEAYQFLQARLAIGSGGVTGAGLGGGMQTHGYVPEAHNDFILAPIGEELGFLGVALVLVLFAILIWRGVRAALGARDVFGGYVAFGITMIFGVQVLFNVGVVLGVVPNKGITLPLVSYGGTSLVITMFLVGLLLNIGRRAEPARRSEAQLQREAARKKRVRVRVAVA